VKKARKAKISSTGQNSKRRLTKTALSKELFNLAEFAQAQGWSAEELLSAEIKRRERILRRQESIKPT
jgi:hypothetical protein